MQWVQLYEMDASLVASVLGALGAEFPHYAGVRAERLRPADHGALTRRFPPPQARVFEQPGVAKELWTVHVMSAGDMDARYLGSRATLEPLFASYGMPANSDYAPVLDRNAARHRFTERSAADMVELLNAEMPLLEMLERGRSRRAGQSAVPGRRTASNAWRTRASRGTRATSCAARRRPGSGADRAAEGPGNPALRGCSNAASRASSTSGCTARCASRRRSIPTSRRDDLNAVWPAFMVSRCYATLNGLQRRWLAFFRAVAARDAPAMAALAEELLATQREHQQRGARILVAAALAGYVANGERGQAPWRCGTRRRRQSATLPTRRIPPAALPRGARALRGGIQRLRGALSEAHLRRAYRAERFGVLAGEVAGKNEDE